MRQKKLQPTWKASECGHEYQGHVQLPWCRVCYRERRVESAGGIPTGPLNCHQIDQLWKRAKQEAKGGEHIPSFARRETLTALEKTLDESATRAKVHAAKCILGLAHGLWDVPLRLVRKVERKPRFKRQSPSRGR